MLLIAPQDRGAAFGSNDGIDRALEHVDPIANPDSECSTGTSFSCDCYNDWHANPGHFPQIVSDRFGLAALFRVDAWKRPRCIDEGQDGAAELLCEFHDTQRLAVALRLRHPEVSILPLLRISSLLVPDQAYGPVPQHRETAHNRSIISEFPVSMDFHEVRAEMFHVIQEIRTLRMPCELYLLVRREVLHILERTIRGEPCRVRRFFQRTPQIRGPARSLRKDSAGRML